MPVGPDGSAVGAWNSSNAESLIRYTVNKGYTINGWELDRILMVNPSNSATSKAF
ncbi:hypothetical protein CsSME_00011455 [Camellia sinensis var. sinensis]